MRTQKALVTSSTTCNDEACEKHRRGNANDTKKKKGVPSSSISTSEFSLQDDVEEVGAEESEEAIFYRFCNK
jgi:hypothetical protein